MASVEPSTFLSQKSLKLDVCKEIDRRVKNLGIQEPSEPISADFTRELWEHLNSLPARYSMYANVDRVDDILTNKKLLESAKDPAKRPAIHVRLIQAYDDEADKPMQIICATVDKPKLLSQFTNVLALMDLSIKEASALSTKDGYSLLEFVVIGCASEHPDQLQEALRNEFLKANQVSGLRRIDPLQGGRLNDDIERQLLFQPDRYWWDTLQVLSFIFLFVAACLLIYVGISMMRGASSEAAIINIAINNIARPIGMGLIGNVTDISDEDIGASVIFVAAPILGILSVLVLLVDAIWTSMVSKAKGPIIFWLVVSFILGCSLPFVKTVVAIKDKASSVFSALVTILAALTNFYRKDCT